MAAKLEDYLYVITRRTIGGATKRYIERMASRQVEDYRLDGFFLDSFLSYVGIASDGSTVTLAASGWTTADEITVTSSISEFTAGDVGNGVTVWIPGGAVIRVTIADYDSATQVRGLVTAVFDPDDAEAVDVPVSMQGITTANWSRAVDVVGGLEHLEGEAVSILANGTVLSGTVTAGEVDLGGLYDVVQVGLPITADLQTLDIDTEQSANLRDKMKLPRSVSLLMDKSRGDFLVGQSSANLRRFRPAAGAILATDIFDSTSGTVRSSVEEVQIDSKYDKSGSIFIRQEDPLPLAILGIIPEGKVGG